MARFTQGGDGVLHVYKYVFTPGSGGSVGTMAMTNLISIKSSWDNSGLINTTTGLGADPQTLAFTIDRDDSATWAFENTYVTASAESPAETLYENGSKSTQSGGSTTEQQLLVIWCAKSGFNMVTGGNATSTGAKYVAMFGDLTAGSEDWNTSANTTNTRTWTFTGRDVPEEVKAALAAVATNSAVLFPAETGAATWLDTQGNIALPFADWWTKTNPSALTKKLLTKAGAVFVKAKT